jgi:hypothetical protein
VVHTNSIAAFSGRIEEAILQQKGKFYDNNEASGDELYESVKQMA